MRTLGTGIVLAIVAMAIILTARPGAIPAATPVPRAAAAPQAPPSTGAAMMKTFASSADVQALLAKAKSEHKEGSVMTAEPILKLAPYTVNLEYRPIEGVVAVHEKEAELVYVIDGGGTLTTGGTVVGEKRTNATNLSGTAIDGGTIQTIGKGDFTIIPEGTPHQFKPAGGPLVLMTFHVPRPISEMQ